MLTHLARRRVDATSGLRLLHIVAFKLVRRFAFGTTWRKNTTMYMDHIIAACALVQIIHILCHYSQRIMRLPTRDGLMPGIGFYGQKPCTTPLVPAPH